MTYLPPKNPIFRLFTPLFRCQDMSLMEQIEEGVRFFDIRITWSKKQKRWVFAHGIVTLGGRNTAEVSEVFDLFWRHRCSFRIILERGGKETEQSFLNTFYKYSARNGCLFIGIKRGWQTLYKSPNFPGIDDRSFVPFRSDKPIWRQISRKVFSTPKRWAKKHNLATESYKTDRVIHFYDFATELFQKCGNVNILTIPEAELKTVSDEECGE